MQNWIYFVLIAQGIWSIATLIDKVVFSKGYIKNPLVYIVLNGLMSIFVIFLLPFIGLQPLRLLDFLIVLFGGVIFSASVVLYYKAVQLEEISKVTILFQLGPIFVLILSFLFLNEILTTNHFIGFLFLLFAGFIVSYKRVNGTFKLSKAFYLMLLSMPLSSIGAVIAKYIYSATNFWNAFLWLRLSGFSALVVLLIPSIRQESVNTFKNMKNSVKGLLSFKMLIDFSAFIFAGYAVLNGPISLVTALSSSALPLFVFMLALVASFYLPKIIKERIDKEIILTKFIALILVIIGIIFVNL